MIRKIKNYLLHLLCIIATLSIITGCNDYKVDIKPEEGGDDENGTEESVQSIICWHLKSFCNEVVDVDIYIDFGEDGTFAIYQRTGKMSYTVFKGTYTIDEENSIMTGIYDDGTPWASSYQYTKTADPEELILESIENPGEVSVYELAELKNVNLLQKSRMAANDIKPL